jgi:hypothetical protein
MALYNKLGGAIPDANKFGTSQPQTAAVGGYQYVADEPAISSYSDPIRMNNGTTRYKDSSGSWMPSGFSPTGSTDPTAQEYGDGGTMPVSFGMNPTGSSAIGDSAYNEQQRMLLADKLARDRMTSLSSLMGGEGTAPRVSMTPGGDETAARAAAFARAKEQAGATARASLRSLQGVMDERGMTGSSTEAAQTGGVLGGAVNTVGDFTREQLMQDLGRAERIADMTYQGNITQRGQDLNRQQALLGLMVGAAY